MCRSNACSSTALEQAPSLPLCAGAGPRPAHATHVPEQAPGLLATHVPEQGPAMPPAGSSHGHTAPETLLHSDMRSCPKGSIFWGGLLLFLKNCYENAAFDRGTTVYLFALCCCCSVACMLSSMMVLPLIVLWCYCYCLGKVAHSHTHTHTHTADAGSQTRRK